MRLKGLKTIGLTALCLALLGLALGAASASALQRTNIYSFGLDGASGTSFANEPTSAAFDQTNNRLYANYVLVGQIGWDVPAAGTFTPLTSPWPMTPTPGTAAATTGIAIDNNPGPLDGRNYRVVSTGLAAFNPDGSPVGGSFPITIPTPRTLCGDAVDSSGNIFIGNAAANAVKEGRGLLRFTSSGTELPPIVTEGLIPGLPCRLAFDSSDNLYVATSAATGQVWKLTAASNYTEATLFDAFAANGIAVDKATGHVFVAHPERITEYDGSGNLIGEFGNENGTSTTKRYLGVAVDEATNEVYVTDSNTNKELRRIRVFGPPTIVTPEAVTNPASGVTRKEATLNGEVDPAGGGGITECKFQWGTTTGYTSAAASCVPAASVGSPISAATAVSATLPATLTPGTLYHYRLFAKNSEGKVTVGADRSFTTIPSVKETVTGAATNITPNSVTLNGSFNADSINTTYWFEYGPTTSYGTKFPLPAPPGANGGNAPTSEPFSQNITGLEPSTSPTGKTYNYRIAATNSFGTTFGENKTFNTLPAVRAVDTEPATEIHAASVRLHGTFDPNGLPTHYYFEYGTTVAYGAYAPVTPPPGEDGGETVGSKTVSAVISNLEAGVTYNYRIVTVNAFGTTAGPNVNFIPNDEPSISGDIATEVNTDSVLLKAVINPNALATTYHFEYGPGDCWVVVCEMGPSIEIGSGKVGVPVQLALSGFEPGSVKHFRVVATNSRGTAASVDHFFETFKLESGVDNCSNVLVRKQTGAGVAPRCRAYELVSAADTGGYDVESNLVSGFHALPGYPRADGKVLYTVRYGAIPGSGNPTNRGGDPYVATRGNEGWTTEYVGFQADGTPSVLPFSSSLVGADDALTTFVFGGPEICAPCFTDGSTNLPVRTPDGNLIEGMTGSEGSPPVEPSGEVRKYVSADGSHLIFGTTTKLAPGGNAGDVSIYSRDLHGGGTQVVSTLPSGATMTGSGISELDVSADGSHVLIGKLVGTDAAGNKSYDLYMHVGNDSHSVQIADTLNGAVYAGMSSDGSRVYFTTPDQLAGDSDASVDLFRADVEPGAATVTRVSTGIESTGDGNGCNPVASEAGNHWNAVGNASPASCGIVAIAGGGGVAEGQGGTAFFLSPEKLDGSSNGTQDQPNLYLAEPGSPPHYVATLDPDNVLIRHGVGQSAVRDTADFQVTPDGRYAAFATDHPLSGAETTGHVEIYRYDSVEDEVACASCAPTNAAPASDTTLTPNGLNLSDDGRVFFTSSEQLVLRDTNQLKDVYEWNGTSDGLVSTGLDTNDSGLLTAGADGKDVYFFTRQALAPQDQNGGAMRIYDAREEGGFLYNPPSHDCLASDECHGPGSQAAAEPTINTVRGTEEPQPAQPPTSAKTCRRGFRKKHGRCVKRHHRHRHHHRHATRHHHG